MKDNMSLDNELNELNLQREVSEGSDNEKDASIEINLKEEDEAAVSDLRKQLMKEEIEKLPPIKEGHISMDGTYIYDQGDKVEVNVYIRNGFNKPMGIDVMPVVLRDSKGNVIAREFINMRDIGVIQPMGARPYKIYFKKENVFVDILPKEGWKIEFQGEVGTVKKAIIELEALPEGLNYEIIDELDKFLKKLPPIVYGDVDINVVKFGRMEDSSISVFLMARNGSPKVAKISTLPIIIMDKEKKVVAGGVFEQVNIMINSGKARVFNFIIDPEFVKDKDIDLKECIVTFEA